MGNGNRLRVILSAFFMIVFFCSCGNDRIDSQIKEGLHGTKCYEIIQHLQLPSVKPLKRLALQLYQSAYASNQICFDVTGGSTSIYFWEFDYLTGEYRSKDRISNFEVLNGRCGPGTPTCKLLVNNPVRALFTTNKDLNDRPTHLFDFKLVEGNNADRDYFLMLTLRTSTTGIQPR